MAGSVAVLLPVVMVVWAAGAPGTDPRWWGPRSRTDDQWLNLLGMHQTWLLLVQAASVRRRLATAIPPLLVGRAIAAVLAHWVYRFGKGSYCWA